MKNIEKVAIELNKTDSLANMNEINLIEIKPKENALYISGAVYGEVFSLKAKEYNVFNDPELSIIL